MKREATISDDQLYRFLLTRAVEYGCCCDRCLNSSIRTAQGYVLWVLCNPSIASAVVDDATERRGWGFTDSWGYGEMRFVNTNPFRSTNPRLARIPAESVLSHNDEYLRFHAKHAALVICAWGTHATPWLAERALKVVRSVAPTYHLGLTKHGLPKHPLYLSDKIRPQHWSTQ